MRFVHIDAGSIFFSFVGTWYNRIGLMSIINLFKKILFIIIFTIIREIMLNNTGLKK